MNKYKKVNLSENILTFSDANGFSVTLRVFSGRANPTWTIQKDHPAYEKVKRLLAGATTYKPENGPSKLWYRGFLVENLNNGNKKPGVLVVGPETKDLQLL